MKQRGLRPLTTMRYRHDCPIQIPGLDRSIIHDVGAGSRSLAQKGCIQSGQLLIINPEKIVLLVTCIRYRIKLET
jgi:hypothetical protein